MLQIEMNCKNYMNFERIGYEVTRVGTSGEHTATYTAKANGYIYE